MAQRTILPWMKSWRNKYALLRVRKVRQMYEQELETKTKHINNLKSTILQKSREIRQLQNKVNSLTRAQGGYSAKYSRLDGKFDNLQQVKDQLESNNIKLQDEIECLHNENKCLKGQLLYHNTTINLIQQLNKKLPKETKKIIQQIRYGYVCICISKNYIIKYICIYICIYT